ncbi:MAG: hypothetical protein QGI78_04000 [Phycisphaerales bacterium]|jgi:tetratricopeptide (TPR) repeat protein|nr:hypothetical protein [Phycisphaerales bacterium]
MNIMYLAIVLLTSAADLQLNPAQQEAVLQEAHVAYGTGVSLQTADPVAAKESFRRSAERFEVLVDDGIENGRLWYNLGNAHLQAQEVGKAIAAYRVAKRFLPSDGRVRANLQHARSLVKNAISNSDRKSSLQLLAFWHTSLPTNARLVLAMTCWSIFWGVLCVRFFIPLPGFKSASVISGIGAIALGVSVSIDLADTHNDEGVLVSNEVIVRKGNGDSFAPMFQEPLYEGVEFTIIEQRTDWLHILLPNGSSGWIQEVDAQVVSLDRETPQKITRL